MNAKSLSLLCVAALCLTCQSQALWATPYTFLSSIGNPTGVAINDSNDKLYVAHQGSFNAAELFEMDKTTGATTSFASLEQRTVNSGTLLVRDVDFNSDGRSAVSIWIYGGDAADNGQFVQVYDAAGTRTASHAVSGRNGVAWGPGGATAKLFIAGEGGLYEVDSVTGAETTHSLNYGYGRSIDFKPDGKALIGGIAKVREFDPNTGVTSMFINGRDANALPTNWYAPNLGGGGSTLTDIAVLDDRILIAGQTPDTIHSFLLNGNAPIIETFGNVFPYDNTMKKMDTDAAGFVYLSNNVGDGTTGAGIYKFDPSLAVPEPTSLVLCMLGLVFGSGIGFCRKRLWS